jgi:hypothetical protein
MKSSEDPARLDVRIDELKEYLTRVETRIDTVYVDMGYVRQNMATRDDLNILRETMATSKDVDRLWKLNWIYLTAIVGLLATLVYFLLSK